MTLQRLDLENEDYKKFLGTHPQMTVQVAKIYWEVEYIDKRIGETTQGGQFLQRRARRIATSRYSSGFSATGNHGDNRGAKQGFRDQRA